MIRALVVLVACAALAVPAVWAGGGRNVADDRLAPRSDAGFRPSALIWSPTREGLTPQQRAVLHRNVRAAAWWAGTVWGVSGRWLASCAASEGGLNHRVKKRGSSGEFYWWQYLGSTWARMKPQALEDARKEGREVPSGYVRIDSPLGQAWVTAWAFANGHSGEWFGSGC